MLRHVPRKSGKDHVDFAGRGVDSLLDGHAGKLRAAGNHPLPLLGGERIETIEVAATTLRASFCFRAILSPLRRIVRT